MMAVLSRRRASYEVHLAFGVLINESIDMATCEVRFIANARDLGFPIEEIRLLLNL